jgi:hypothetical protein
MKYILKSGALMDKSEIILYQLDDTVSVEVRFEQENVWLNRHQIATLFDRDIKTIGKHINNALNEELAVFSTVANFATVETGENRSLVVAKFATTATNGKIYQMEYYSLDVILSVGYRVKSGRGIQFRIWANHILKNYLLKGYAVNERFERLENRVTKTEEKIDFFVKTALPPLQGIFYDGQVFDAYELASKIIRSAKSSIVLIDNYIDEHTITHLTKKIKNVKVLLLTKNISKQLALDIQKANEQYGGFTAKQFTQSHDRFLIIDEGKDVYHIGASLKDLGKKWFAFSKMDSISISNIVKSVSEIVGV